MPSDRGFDPSPLTPMKRCWSEESWIVMPNWSAGPARARKRLPGAEVTRSYSAVEGRNSC